MSAAEGRCGYKSDICWNKFSRWGGGEATRCQQISKIWVMIFLIVMKIQLSTWSSVLERIFFHFRGLIFSFWNEISQYGGGRILRIFGKLLTLMPYRWYGGGFRNGFTPRNWFAPTRNGLFQFWLRFRKVLKSVWNAQKFHLRI